MRGQTAGRHAASVEFKAVGSGLADHKPPDLPEAGGSTRFTEEYYLDTSKSFSDSASPLCPLSQPLDCAHFNLSELLSQKLDKGSLWAVWSA